MEKIKPMLTMNGSVEKWYPATIDTLRAHLSVLIVKNAFFTESKVIPLRNNIAYNLQYIEFLDRVIKDINLSDVLLKQNIKSFVVHSAAVIEAIFYYLVVSSGNAATSDWISCNKFKSNPYTLNGGEFQNETEIFAKSDHPINLEMTFDQMSKKVTKKRLLGEVGELYKEIGGIRKLRNKIHIYSIENLSETDYNSFQKSEYRLTRNVLLGILTSPIFSASKNQKCYDYLKND